MKSWGMAGVLSLTVLSACTGATTPGDQISFVEDQDGSVTDPNNLITGGDTIQHLDDNLGALDIELDDTVREKLDKVSEAFIKDPV